MADPVTSGPIFRFDINTTGVFQQRKVRFIRRSDFGYLVEFLPSEQAEAVPDIMKGSRPDAGQPATPSFLRK